MGQGGQSRRHQSRLIPVCRLEIPHDPAIIADEANTLAELKALVVIPAPPFEEKTRSEHLRGRLAHPGAPCGQCVVEFIGVYRLS
jgi:hypothetical protein